MALITVQFDTANAADVSLFAGLFHGMNAQPGVASNPGTTSPVVLTDAPFQGDGGVVGAADVVEAAPIVDKPKRTRKPKEDNVQDTVQPEQTAPVSVTEQHPEPQPVEAPVFNESESAPIYTLDDVRSALQGFTATKSIEDAMALLREFGAARISELKEEDYAAFIEKAKA